MKMLGFKDNWVKLIVLAAGTAAVGIVTVAFHCQHVGRQLFGCGINITLTLLHGYLLYAFRT